MLRPPVRRERSAWFWSALGVAPYFLIYFAHALPGDDRPGWSPTGFVQGDQPQYIALGRAVFAHGNGLTGPNVYEADPGAPSIYFHTITWLLGLAVRALPIDPGAIYVGFGIASAVVLGRLTLALVERSGAGPHRVPLVLLAMWGGGIAALMALGEDLWHGRSIGLLIRYEPWMGWWMPAWGRNVVYSTEAFYHTLMAAVWLAALGRRWFACLAGVAFVAATHPFTGIQALAIVLSWWALARIGPAEDRVPDRLAAAIVGVAVLLVGYYLGFLPRYPPHRAMLEAQTSSVASEAMTEALATCGPVALLALLRLRRDGWRIVGTEGTFLWAAAGASFALAHHDWLVRPRLPLHYTHGYVWMPLFLLGVPILRDVLDWAGRRPVRLAVVAPAFALACLDNAAWIARLPQAGELRACWLPPGAREAYRAIDRLGLRGVLLSRDPMVGCLAAVYTDCLPYLGHGGLTPRYLARVREASDWFERGEAGPWFDRVDAVLARDGDPLPSFVSGGWDRAYRGEGWSLYLRTERAGPGLMPRSPGDFPEDPAR